VIKGNCAVIKCKMCSDKICGDKLLIKKENETVSRKTEPNIRVDT
jgi:hypothetical protein